MRAWPIRRRGWREAGGAEARVAASVGAGLAPGPLILGHRGASAHAPENSTDAFERAAADGADGVELDVLLCGSGEAVVFHDDDLSRLGAGRRDRIAALSLEALREVRLASGAAIPTLGEAFEACGRSMLVNVELKASGLSWGALGRLVAAVAAVVEHAAMEGRVLVSSFHPGALWLWHRRAPRVPFGLLFEREAPIWLRRAWSLRWLGPTSAHPERVLCTPVALARWHALGCAVHAWTVDDDDELRRLRDLGVDGVITNDPARARRALARPTGGG
jgi:glycerophosphoryl diester phosphodiesterase